MSGARGCLRYTLALALVCAALVLLACPVGALAARRGYYAPPTVHRRFGTVWFHAVATADPVCPMVFCGTQRIIRQQGYYIVWVEMLTTKAGRAEVRGYRLLELSIRR